MARRSAVVSLESISNPTLDLVDCPRRWWPCPWGRATKVVVDNAIR